MNIDAGQVRTEHWVNTTTVTPRLQHNAIHTSYDTQSFQENDFTFANRTFFVEQNMSQLSKYGGASQVFDEYVYRLTRLDIGTLPDLQTAAHVTESQPANITWLMKTFVIVAGSLTFGSMIGLLVISHVFSSVARFSVQKRRLFRVIASNLWLT